MEISNVYIDFHLNIEEGTPIFKVQATCSIFREYSDQQISIGEATIYLCDPTKSLYEDLCGEASCISTNLSGCLTSLEKICGATKIDGLVATCHSINMREEWQNKGLEQVFMEKLMNQFSFLHVELFLAPIDKLNVNRKAVFRRLGFQSLEYDENISVMYKYLCNMGVASAV